jgi:hypothetical protein
MSAYIAPRKDADVVLIDAPDDGTQSSALDQAWRYRHDWRRDFRRRATLCRPQPQHTTDHAQGACGALARNARFRNGNTLRQ